jgi:RimJ/RimL family protein N-acetyltransferase
MGIYNLDRIFNPGAIAVIGASEKAASVGSTLMLNLVQSGFKGDLFPVNPRHRTIHGLKTLSSIQKAERSIDLAVIATPIETVPSIIKDCVQKGVKGAIILSAGGKEAGVNGREIEAQIGKYAREGGLWIFVRPIRPEDAPILVNLFDTLSPTSIYYRFFGHLKSLPHYMLVRFTQVDYDREIDLVAVDDGDNSEERILGVARFITDPDGKRAEFAILTGDPWQGKGVGARLLEISLGIAKNRGIETVWGTVLQENQGMLALGRKLGFKISRSQEPGEMELTIDLRSITF